jgi:hypothetical protein
MNSADMQVRLSCTVNIDSADLQAALGEKLGAAWRAEYWL